MLLFVGTTFYAIWLPNHIRSGTFSTKSTCIANLKQIDGAIQQWAVVNKLPDTAKPDWNAAMVYLKNGQHPPCPNSGSYGPGKTIADAPTCSKGKELGHMLP
ncbi:MAG: hypothetical protein K0Q55_2609 [Verrucomicrobia bacterium]|nr:hypothetical protein [Verrucomicrobiota bacterium]